MCMEGLGIGHNIKSSHERLELFQEEQIVQHFLLPSASFTSCVVPEGLCSDRPRDIGHEQSAHN